MTVILLRLSSTAYALIFIPSRRWCFCTSALSQCYFSQTLTTSCRAQPSGTSPPGLRSPKRSTGTFQCGGVAIVLVIACLPNLPPTDRSDGSKWRELDYVGAFLSIAMVTLLLLPLQWGGNTRPWSDPLVIALLVVVRELAGSVVPAHADGLDRGSCLFLSLSRGSIGWGRRPSFRPR